MGEYSGYLNPGRGSPQPIFNVTAMTYRNDPILPVVAAGEPIEENHTCWGLAISAQILSELRQHGFPVTTCFCPFQSAAHWLVVTVNKTFTGRACAEKLVKQLADVLFHSRAGVLVPKVILLNDDIDPSNFEEVVWAFATRCHPEHGQFLFPNQEVLPLLGYLSQPERKARRSTNAIYHGLPLDDLPPERLPKRSSFHHLVPPALQEKVIQNWQHYGYRDE
jgi:UbiD family decarboxylase